MSAETVGKEMPAVVTLADLAAMNAADQHGHRYEMSPEGALSIMPPADSVHAKTASRLFAWLLAAGWPAEQVLQVAGIRIPGADGDGGRIPDLTVWSKPPRDGVWLAVTDLLLVIEIVSAGSQGIDEVVKRTEYASAGIPRYWVVDRDPAQTVTLFQLGPNGDYVEHAKMPIAWLLNTPAAEHLDL
jgi:Uma2 family endonuclease